MELPNVELLVSYTYDGERQIYPPIGTACYRTRFLRWMRTYRVALNTGLHASVGSSQARVFRPMSRSTFSAAGRRTLLILMEAETNCDRLSAERERAPRKMELNGCSQ
jgi:hypothetical protein